MAWTTVFSFCSAEERSAEVTISDHEIHPAAETRAQAEELPQTKLQDVSDFHEEFVPGTMCK